MTENTDNNLPEHQEPSVDDVNKASNDLQEAAKQALERFNSQEPDDDKSDVDSTTSVEVVSVGDEEGNTTNDLQQEAYQAMKLKAEHKRDEEIARTTSDKNAVFTEDMRLKLSSDESSIPIVKEVKAELVVGRADNVTDYLPDIDLTPHGAYRLGLSRRHAIILCEDNQILVKDLNSRNGTFVNGIIVPGGGTQVVHHGDEIRFGNLLMRVAFES